jgi:peptidyl-prolyl cis-trans isomerase SurA
VRPKATSICAAALYAIAAVLFLPANASAQEGELQLVDEVVAQVNDDVITLSRLKRESAERVQSLTQNGVSEQEAQAEVNKRQAELVATLINEQLLLQKGKELELSDDVEAEVNSRMLDVAKSQGINSIAKLEEIMRAQHMDPNAVRQTLRAEIMKQAVIQREVDSKIFLSLTMEDLKKYYAEHPDKFRKPESVAISEIYLSLEGKDPNAVKARAEQLVAQLRSGADFAAVAAANSERQVNGKRVAPEDGGKVGTFEVPSLREDIADAIKNVKVGGVTDPIQASDGVQIVRVDERTPASDTPSFNENKVREAITIERSPRERDEYLQGLRSDAYISISDDYREAVAAILKLPLETASAKKDEDTVSRQKLEEKKKKGWLPFFRKKN